MADQNYSEDTDNEDIDSEDIGLTEPFWLEYEMAHLRRKLARAEVARDRAERTLALMQQATLWRLTAPLRALLDSWPGRTLRRSRRGTATVAAIDSSDPSTWFATYTEQRDPSLVRWRGAMTMSVVMPVYRPHAAWLAEAIASVRAQTYPHWQLICVDDGSDHPTITAVLKQAAGSDRRIVVRTLAANVGAAAATNAALDLVSGSYVLFLDHDDALEPHALARFADAAYQTKADLLYADEALCGAMLTEVRAIHARPAFSHAYYLSHAYFVHPLAVRTSLARSVGFAAGLRHSQDVDFVLRVLERATRVTHIPDVLYRWRTTPASLGHQVQSQVMAVGREIRRAHLQRLGYPAPEMKDGLSFNTFVTSNGHQPTGRILAIIPTKNRVALLRRCIETVQATTAGLPLDFVVIDHQSDDAETCTYLATLTASQTARVLPFSGPFNYSKINNAAVAAFGGGYEMLLFLNNDIEAREPGWLQSMIMQATMPNVGAVGATLLYPDGRVQHAGVVIGMKEAAEHAYRFSAYGPNTRGYLSGLHATRDVSAVTAACMLVQASAFAAVDGFDEMLAVGFNDTDFCMRLRAAEWRVIQCAEAVLLHHESASRGKSPQGQNPHPTDSALFKTRYDDLFLMGDPFFSPFLDLDYPCMQLKPGARFAVQIDYRTMPAQVSA